MSRRPSAYEYEDRRNARIRALREQREGPMRRRRRVQPLLLLMWIVGTIALLGVLIVVGFNAVVAPRVMEWVQENPGAITHGIVQDFVEWYDPATIANEPASDQHRRVTVTIAEGATEEEIGQQLFSEGLISSEVAFQYAIINAGREGTIAAGSFDLSPTLRPSEIVAALQGQDFGPTTTVTLTEGDRLEEMVATFADSEITMNIEEFAAILQAPPAELLNEFTFLADVPAGRSLEGYIRPDTYEFQISGENATPTGVVRRLLTEFGAALTEETMDGIRAKGLTLNQSVIIASIVEREAVIDEERPRIAAVYINRLQNPDLETVGLLNADPTLQYGLSTGELRPEGHPMLVNTEGAFLPVDEWGSVEWWPQLQVGGGEVALEEYLLGFQTYTRAGLPPMPIASPRTGSLEAVAQAPIDEGFLYFVAGCPNGVRDGSHYFAKTLPEHNANIAKANEECAGL
jgi:peptidoglycan lytic transglycosylase G